MKLEQKYKGFVFREISFGEEEVVRALIFKILEEFELRASHANDEELDDIHAHFKNGFFGVIVYNEMIVGTFALKKLNEKEAEIRKMYLKKEYRGKGLGEFAVKLLIELAQKQHFEILSLETSSRLNAAIGLYSKLGFKEINSENKSERCDKQFLKSLNT